jgi:hypothetical protein
MNYANFTVPKRQPGLIIPYSEWDTGFNSPQAYRIFLFSKKIRQALEDHLAHYSIYTALFFPGGRA